jgi:hypothetical protein
MDFSKSPEIQAPDFHERASARAFLCEFLQNSDEIELHENLISEVLSLFSVCKNPMPLIERAIEKINGNQFEVQSIKDFDLRLQSIKPLTSEESDSLYKIYFLLNKIKAENLSISRYCQSILSRVEEVLMKK